MSKLMLNGLAKSFEGKPVIRDLSFTVEEGEFVSIIGPSGSGKSTLFHLIGGLYKPEAGQIVLDGQEITGKKGEISYMPQNPSLLPWRTILDNVVLAGEVMGKANKREAAEMIQKAGLSGYENKYPHQLSGGMKQRVSFIRSLLSPQSLMCLDEPFSALDEFTRMEMQHWLLSIWEQDQRSVLFITHNIEEALYLSDRIILLSDRPANVQQEYTIPFNRPRSQTLMLTNEFLNWKKAIYQELKVLI